MLSYHKSSLAPSEHLQRHPPISSKDTLQKNVPNNTSSNSNILLSQLKIKQPMKLAFFKDNKFPGGYWGHVHSSMTREIQKYKWELNDRLEIEISDYFKDESNIFLLKILRNLKNLQTLIINLKGRSSMLSLKGLEQLVMCISRNLFHLKQLSFSFQLHKKNEEYQNKELNFLANQLFKALPHLEKLTIFYGPNLSFETFRFLSKRMTVCLPKLQSFSANFKNCNALIDRSLTTLVIHTSLYLKNLNSLSLSFEGSRKFRYRGFNSFSKLLGLKLSHLHHLSLQFGTCGSFDHKALNILTYNVFTKLTRLQSFEILLPSSSQIWTQGFEDFANNMSYNENKLKKLKIDLSHRSQRSDKDLEILSKGISMHLSNLEELSLCFTNTVISNQGIEAIENSIAEKLLNLTKLTLEFADNRFIKPQRVLSLGLKISENLHKLKELDLGFPALNQATWYGTSEATVVEEILKKHNFLKFKFGV